MTGAAILQVVVYLIVLVLLAWPLGRYVARVYRGDPHPLGRLLGRVLGPLERGAYRALGTRADHEMTWRQYAVSVLGLSLVGAVVLYLLQRLQGGLPLDPAGLGGTTPEVAFNTAVSFVTNTNWQAYAGERTMSHLTQMAGLTTQNFVSAAVGIGVLFALFRGLTRAESKTVGNPWVDLVRVVLYLLVPLALVLAIVLVSQGVVQTFEASATATTLEGAQQTIALGPVASQLAIKQLGTNGGGFFNVNSAHPFENPTALTNLVELIAILLVPTALCFTFGEVVKDRRQGVAVLAAMMIVFVPATAGVVAAEQAGNPALPAEVDQVASPDQPGGNMEGKEARFGITSSGLWAAATTAASNGSVNAMHDSFTPLGGMVPMVLMQLGEVIFGGVGSGLYGMLVFVIVAVFVGGLMVGRTPEYLGKKVEAFEMKMASLVVLVPCAAVLIGTAVAVASAAGTEPLGNRGPHGFSEILYAFTSGANNNGSAFAGLTADG
ncbi:MAG: potassium-transporting ATPase subunit KdpA, partial [Deltaproteobacteria bacterium]|nr:potassium-transporting ATPase subunit KdpA [Deltaproteobacteria bacterium]